MIAPPHFFPNVDLEQCTYCGRCTRNCPTGATVVDATGRVRQHLTERCIGCGLCAVACDQGAIQMEANPDYRQRPETITSTLLQIGPNYLRNAWTVWRQGR